MQIAIGILPQLLRYEQSVPSVTGPSCTICTICVMQAEERVTYLKTSLWTKWCVALKAMALHSQLVSRTMPTGSRLSRQRFHTR